MKQPYLVRCIDDCTRFEIGEVLSVTSVSADANGNVLLGIENNLPVWRAEHFEEVVVSKEYSESNTVSYITPEPEVCIPASEMVKLLDTELWWKACLLGKVMEYCDWDVIVNHYKELKKESKE